MSWQANFSIACREGHEDRAGSMLAEINNSDSGMEKAHALHTASGYGMHRLLLNVLETLAVDPNQQCERDGFTALHRAATNGHLEVVSVLIGASADVNIQSQDGSTPLHLASRGGHLDVINKLIVAKADVNATTNDGSAALHFAARNGHSRVVQVLVDAKANVSMVTNEMITPLHYASVLGDPDIIRFILKAGANPCVSDEDGKTPLHIAALHGCVGVVEVLLAGGANLWELTKDDETALHLSAKSGYSAVSSVLIAASKDREAKIKRQNSWCLVNSDAEPMQPPSEATTPCQDLSEKDYLHLLNKAGKSALHIAVGNNHYNMSQDLLRGGISANIKDRNGWTPLHVAADLNLGEMIRLLLDNGAGLDEKTQNGATPIDIARRHDLRGHDIAISSLKRASSMMELLQYGTCHCEDVTIAVGGAPGAGKTTFVDSIKTTWVEAIWRYENYSDKGSMDPATRTRGIRLVSVKDSSLGHTKHFMDFGGHDEFIPAHSLFLSESSTPSLAVVLVDGMLVRKQKHNLMRLQLEQWCGVFVSCNRKLPRRQTQPSIASEAALAALPDQRMPIVVIISRGKDLSVQECADALGVYGSVCKKFHHYLAFENMPCFLDCRKARDAPMTAVKNLINDITNRLIKDAGQQPRIMQVIRRALPRVRKKIGMPYCHRTRFTRSLLEILSSDSKVEKNAVDFSTASASQVIEPALQLLSRYGELITFESPQLKDTVVIDPTWLLTRVVGQLCSPKFFPQPHVAFDEDGRARKEDVIKSLSEPKQPGAIILDMLTQLGLCIIDRHHVIVPSKLPPLKASWCPIGGWLRNEKNTHYAGVRFTCEGSIPLSAGFVVLLQTRIFSDFSRHHGMAPKLTLRCLTVVPCQSDVQGTVIVHPTRLAVDVVARGPDDSQRDMFALLQILCRQVRDTADQYSPGSVLDLHILSSSELCATVNDQSTEFPRVMYSPSAVRKANRGNQLMDHPDRQSADKALDLLYLPPNHIHLVSAESLNALCALLDLPSDRDWKHFAEVLGFSVSEIRNLMFQPDSKTKHMLRLWAERSPNNSVKRLLDAFEKPGSGHVDAAAILQEELSKPYLGIPDLFMARKQKAAELEESHCPGGTQG